MKTRPLMAMMLTASVFAWTTEATARGDGGRARGGGGGGGGASRPAARPAGGGAASRPAARPSSRPSGGGRPSVSRPSGGDRPSISRPSGGSGSSRPASSRPQTRPAPRPEVSRPETRPAPRPETRPSGGGGSSLARPSTRPSPPSINKPMTRPAPRPETRPAPRPGVADRPGDLTRPAPRPGAGGGRPGGGAITLPGQGVDRPGLRPETKPAGRPGVVDRPGDLTRPSTRPGTVRPGGGLNKPGGGPGIVDRPGGGGRPGSVRPSDRPGLGDRPGWDNRPGDRPGGWGDNRPGDRPGWGNNRPESRPNWGDKWNNSNNSFTNQFNNWHQENNVTINNFQNNRSNRWNDINTRYNDRDWHNRFDSDEYWKWRRDVVDFRRDRCHEVWDHCYGYHDRFFHHGYWGGCWWGAAVAGTAAAVTSAIISPWWWWRPATYTTVATFYGPTYPAQPVIYDPGTTVIYEGDTIYINGRESGNAVEYRQKTIELASPPVETYPVPEPPAEEGQPENWLPMGVWALTQQEQGDAVMFFQLSVDKEGIVAGAFKNIMTGEDQPVVGQLDKEGQRLAWHVGENTDTVYETGLSSLTYDAASVFVHFGPEATQTWLLVRLPSPEMPPGAVKLPEIRKPEPGTK